MELSILRMSTILAIGHKHNMNLSHVWSIGNLLLDKLENGEKISASKTSEIFDFLIVLPLLIRVKAILNGMVKGNSNQFFKRFLF